MRILLISFSIFFISVAVAQNDTNTLAPPCTFTIDPPVYGIIDFTGEQYDYKILVNASMQTKHVPYGASNNTLTDVTYPTLYKPNPNPPPPQLPYDEPCNSSKGSIIGCDPATDETLSYDVYYPISKSTGSDLRTCKFPAIILFHGGGFSDCKADGEDEGGSLPIVAQEFAKRGYVAFLVEYRTGRYKAGTYIGAQQVLAEYRALQDARGAIRSIIKHQKVHTQGINFTNDPYQIDLSNIFIGGNSAGSVMAIQTAYYNATQIAQIFPVPAGNYPSVIDALGQIDNDNYYGKVSDAPDLRVIIRGVLDMWGQAAFPKSYAPNNLQNFWKDSPNPPLIGFHGKEDDVLPFNKSPIYFAPPGLLNPANINYNSESNCIASGLPNPFTLDQNGSTPDLAGAGSKGIYDILKAPIIDQHVELYIDCDMMHGVDKNRTDRDNFGLPGNPSYYDVYKYIVQRATTFFQVVITNQLPNLTNKRDLFYECVNTRVKSYDPPNTPQANSVFNNSPGNCTNGNDCDPNTP